MSCDDWKRCRNSPVRNSQCRTIHMAGAFSLIVEVNAGSEAEPRSAPMLEAESSACG
jgi:hypothetical protein